MAMPYRVYGLNGNLLFSFKNKGESFCLGDIIVKDSSKYKVRNLVYHIEPIFPKVDEVSYTDIIVEKMEEIK